MATANAPLEFTGEQTATLKTLAMAMKGAAAVLLLLGATTVVLGVLRMLKLSPGAGMLTAVEGFFILFLGSMLWVCSTHTRYMVQTPYTSIHLGHVFKNLTDFFTAQSWLAVLLILVWLFRTF